MNSMILNCILYFALDRWIKTFKPLHCIGPEYPIETSAQFFGWLGACISIFRVILIISLGITQPYYQNEGNVIGLWFEIVALLILYATNVLVIVYSWSLRSNKTTLSVNFLVPVILWIPVFTVVDFSVKMAVYTRLLTDEGVSFLTVFSFIDFFPRLMVNISCVLYMAVLFKKYTASSRSKRLLISSPILNSQINSPTSQTYLIDNHHLPTINQPTENIVQKPTLKTYSQSFGYDTGSIKSSRYSRQSGPRHTGKRYKKYVPNTNKNNNNNEIRPIAELDDEMKFSRDDVSEHELQAIREVNREIVKRQTSGQPECDGSYTLQNIDTTWKNPAKLRTEVEKEIHFESLLNCSPVV